MKKLILGNKIVQSQKGFTLIEMAIVLIIVSFLIAGIIGSRVLIRQNQVSSIITDVQSFVSATKSFQQKYSALPGDMPNATTYWGALSTCPPTAGMASPGGTATCNGNGDGQIYNFEQATGVQEPLLYWQHLANAQMIPGYYTGIGSTTTTGHLVGVNCPVSKVDGAGYGMWYLGALSGNPAVFNGIYQHAIMYGITNPGGFPEQPALTGAEAYNLDSKFDDGVPNTGNVLSVKNASSCYTLASGLYTYNSSSTSNSCAMVFKTGF